jgi:hypothetical protein
VGDVFVESSTSARNLGSIWDEKMNMEAHVNSICKACYFHLSNISAIRESLTRNATEKLIHAFVTSRLDNGNVLLVNLPRNLIAKLQRVLNTAARILTRSSKYCSITTIMKELHWLPVIARIKFKTCVLTWKALHGNAPSYIQELLVPYNPSRTLRSADCSFLVVPKCRVNYGERAFAVAAPKCWNSLPVSLRKEDSFNVFKKDLKTFLFLESYPAE